MQVPQLKLYRACIYDHQKKLITGISPTANTNANNELPRQNNDRDNAVLGAQGLSKFLGFEMISDWPRFSSNQPIRAGALGGYFFKWRTVLYFFLETGERYRPNSFFIVI